VTADGRLRTASAAENEDLFLGGARRLQQLRVVTSFEFRAHPVGPMVMVGAVFYPFEDVPRLVRASRDTVTAARDRRAQQHAAAV
jgi:hypothetical protein